MLFEKPPHLFHQRAHETCRRTRHANTPGNTQTLYEIASSPFIYLCRRISSLFAKCNLKQSRASLRCSKVSHIHTNMNGMFQICRKGHYDRKKPAFLLRLAVTSNT
jgi:hypothetical protein